MEVIREGRWICPNCNTKNKGSELKCPACGATRGEVEFIYDENAEEVTDEGEKKRAVSGADWVCGFCGVSNSFDVGVCKSCSGKHGEGKNRTVKEIHPTQPKAGVATPQAPSRPTPAAPMPTWMKFGCMGFAFLFAVLMVFEMMDYPQTLEVIGRKWERVMDIQEYKTISHDDWLDKVPSSGRIFSRTEKVRSHKKVQTGTKEVTESYSERVQTGTKRVKTGVTDLGNGKFKETYRDEPVYSSQTKTRRVQKPVYREDPVYDTWTSFYNDEWTNIEQPSSNGTNEDPVWPDKGLPRTSPNIVGQRRANPKSESYEVTFKSQKDGKEFIEKKINDKKLDSDIFSRFKKGTKWEAVISGLGNLKSVKLDGK